MEVSIYGEKEKSVKGRWTPHTGNLNTFFSNNELLKSEFILSINKTFNDDKPRYFVPEVNSGEEDLQSIIYDLLNFNVIFDKIIKIFLFLCYN